METSGVSSLQVNNRQPLKPAPATAAVQLHSISEPVSNKHVCAVEQIRDQDLALAVVARLACVIQHFDFDKLISNVKSVSITTLNGDHPAFSSDIRVEDATLERIFKLLALIFIETFTTHKNGKRA